MKARDAEPRQAVSGAGWVIWVFMMACWCVGMNWESMRKRINRRPMVRFLSIAVSPPPPAWLTRLPRVVKPIVRHSGRLITHHEVPRANSAVDAAAPCAKPAGCACKKAATPVASAAMMAALRERLPHSSDALRESVWPWTRPLRPVLVIVAGPLTVNHLAERREASKDERREEG